MSDKFKSVESLMDGYNPQRQLLEQTRKLVKKWEPTGLLEGMDKEHEVNGMAVLLENQARQLIDEASRTGTSANSEEWSGVALPLVRRIFGELAAQEFVSVQPMNLPSGLIFYLDFKYGTAQTDLHTNDSDVYGNTSGSGDASGGLYGAGKFGYSINDSDSAAQAIHASSVASGTYTTGSAAWSDVDFEPDLSSSIVTGQFADDGLIKINVATAALSDYDEDGVRAFSISGSGFDEFFPAYTTLNAAKTQIAFIVKKSIAGAPGALVVSYHKVKGTNYDRTDFEASAADIDANPEADIDIPELDIALKSIPIMLYANASAKTEKWSAKVGYELNNAGTAFEETAANASAYTKGEWFQTLGNKIQSVSNAIHQKTLRGGANFLVVSPETATIIESIPGYAADTSGEATEKTFAMGVQRVGALNNRFTVYKNPYAQDNVILAGFRGSNFLETGAVYAPYVPLIMTPLVYDPKNFTPRKGVMTRYAKKMVRPEFYGKIVVADVNLV